MKKFLCLFSALSMVLMSSCSSDENNTPTEENTSALPSKITETLVENGKSGELDYTFTYDGKKLKQIALSDASKYVYTYTGEFITKIELYKSSILIATDAYTYENGKLVSKITTKTGSTIQPKLTFVYNANGTVNANESEIIDRQEVKYDTTTLYTFANGNLISAEYINGERDKETSTYDDKKSPFRNITGLKLLMDLDTEFDFYSSNNTLTSKTEYFNADGKLVKTSNAVYVNKYNGDNYLSEVFSGDASDSFKLQITY